MHRFLIYPSIYLVGLDRGTVVYGGTAGLGFSSLVQEDVRGGFSPSCCSTTLSQLACDLDVSWIVFYFSMIRNVSCSLFWRINRALGLKQAVREGCVC